MHVTPASYQHVHNARYAKVIDRKATSPKLHAGDKVRITRSRSNPATEFEGDPKAPFSIASTKL